MALTIQNYLQNCTAVITPSTIEKTTNVNVVITANQGYTLKNLDFLYIAISGWQVSKRFENWIFSNNYTTATININLANEFTTEQQNNLEYFRLYGTAKEKQIHYLEVSKEQENNCIITAPETVDVDGILQITITANENYIFEVAPRIEIYGGNIIDIYNLELNENENIATISFNFSDYYDQTDKDILRGVEIYANAAPNINYRHYGALNVYKVTTKILNEFSKKRYKYGDQQNLTVVDLGNFVINIKKYFFDINNVVENQIKCGYYDTNINASTPLENVFEFDCGNITILPIQNNIIDFENEMQLFLPFVGFVNFSNDYINKEINLKYYINIVTNKGIAKLFYNNNEIEQFECTPCINVVFKFLNFDNLENNANDLKGLTPYVIVKRFTGFCSNYNTDNRQILLKDLPTDTFVKCKLINQKWQTPAYSYQMLNNEEINLLETELKNGVYI